MKISLVVAMSRDGLIGREGGLPWKLARDLKHFRLLTWGKPIVMGRTTHEGLGRPLPGRTNIILTHSDQYQAEGCLVAHSCNQALELARATGSPEAMIIGGSQVYREFLPLADRVHLTLVDGAYEGDTFFPAPLLDSPHWFIVHEEVWPSDESNPVEARYLVLERRLPAEANAT